MSKNGVNQPGDLPKPRRKDALLGSAQTRRSMADELRSLAAHVVWRVLVGFDVLEGGDGKQFEPSPLLGLASTAYRAASGRVQRGELGATFKRESKAQLLSYEFITLLDTIVRFAELHTWRSTGELGWAEQGARGRPKKHPSLADAARPRGLPAMVGKSVSDRGGTTPSSPTKPPRRKPGPKPKWDISDDDLQQAVEQLMRNDPKRGQIGACRFIVNALRKKGWKRTTGTEPERDAQSLAARYRRVRDRGDRSGQ